MMSLAGQTTRTWNPDCHRGETRSRETALRRKDLWFYLVLAVLLVLLFVVWQQNRGMQLGAEVARLELRREALRTKILEQGVVVAQRRQPAALAQEGEGEGADAGLAISDLEGRVFVGKLGRDQATTVTSDTWLASVGLGVAPALAGEDR
jgi:hypothetical protein